MCACAVQKTTGPIDLSQDLFLKFSISCRLALEVLVRLKCRVFQLYFCYLYDFDWFAFWKSANFKIYLKPRWHPESPWKIPVTSGFEVWVLCCTIFPFFLLEELLFLLTKIYFIELLLKSAEVCTKSRPSCTKFSTENVGQTTSRYRAFCDL